MHATFQKARHSAEVEIELLVAGKSLSVAQLGPEFLILGEATQLEPCTAEIVLRVDGEDERWQVRLPVGSAPGTPRVAIQQL